MNRWQSAFVLWNAQRLGITEGESRARFERSNAVIDHGGRAYRDFCDTSHRLYGVFADDSEREVIDSYKQHANMHFLRMLSYSECDTDWRGHPVFNTFVGKRVVIADLGCGLAQVSLTLAIALKAAGAICAVQLADIDTLRADFLLWLCERESIDCIFHSCDWRLPSFEPCDVMVAIEVFEHLHDPLAHLRLVDDALLPGGFLLTNVGDHQPEFMHVSPDLSVLRTFLRERGYDELTPNRLYRKP